LLEIKQIIQQKCTVLDDKVTHTLKVANGINGNRAIIK